MSSFYNMIRLQKCIIAAILVTLLPNLKMFLSVEFNFGNHQPEQLLKISEISREISAVEFCYSKAIAFFILLMFLKFMILWNYIMIYGALLLILISSQPYLNLK